MGTLCRYSVLVILCILLIPGVASPIEPCYSGVITIPAASMQPRFTTYDINNVGGFLSSNSIGHVNFYAPLMLPNKAHITKVVLDAYDHSTTAYIDVNLRRGSYAAASTLLTFNTTAAAALGDHRYAQGNLNIPIDNGHYSYFFDVHFWNVGSTGNRFYRLVVYFDLFDCPSVVTVIPPN
jgi:hypothetical protein